MPRRDQVTRKGQIEALRRQAALPETIRARTEAVVHVRSTTSGVCPCCSSPLAKIDDRWPDLDVLMDLEAGRRYFRHLEDHGAYDEQAALAELDAPMLIRCTPETLELVFSETTWTVGTGASRSGKTQTGAYWMLRQWLLRGGPSVLGAILGFELEQAHIIKDKFCIGEGENPAVCDPRLVLGWPDHIRSPDQHIRMCDGTRMRLQHTKGNGGNISGRSYHFVVWTEIAQTKNPLNYAQVRGRVVSARGKLYGDAVPEPGHWAHRVLVEPSEEWEVEAKAARAKGEEPPKRTHLAKFLPTQKNPWNDPEEAAAFEADLMRLDPRIAARYARGQWVGDKNKTFGELFVPERHCFDYEGWDPKHLGYADITRTASLHHFMEPHDWIVAVDVNRNPHTALMGKLVIPTAELVKDPTGAIANRSLWGALFFDLLQDWDMDSQQAAQHLARLHGGRFAGAGVIIDASSCYKKHNAGGLRNTRKGFVPRRCYEEAGFEVRPPALWVKSGKPKDPDRFDSAIVVRRLLRDFKLAWEASRCRKVTRAVRDQDSEDDGITPARASNTAADRHIVSVTDVLRYFTWPFLPVDAAEAAPVAVRTYA